MNWMEGDFLAMKKFCPWLKTHFPSISQANIYVFSIGKDFLFGQKIFSYAKKACEMDGK